MAEVTARDALERAREIEEQLREEIPERLKNAGGWVRKHAAEQPLAAVGIALAAGFVLGRLIRGLRA